MNIDQYNKMAEVFGSTFEPDETPLSEESEAVEIRTRDDIKQELIQTSNKNELSTDVVYSNDEIEDQDYIQHELRVGIEMLGDVADVLRSDLKQGSRASSFEAFSSIMRERRDHINTLKDVNTEKFERKNKDLSPSGTNDGTNITNNNLILTSNDALDLILQAKNGIDKDI
jgi:hypothetical protein